MHTSSPAAVPHTLREILSQPRVWHEALETLRREGDVDRILGQFTGRGEWLFVGCGTSYYLAQAAAATWTELGCGFGRAVPASDLLLFTGLALGRNSNVQPVLISRSGLTSEVLQAAELLERRCNLRTIGITCAEGSPLEERCTAIIRVAAADEKSTVMTRSFTTMLLVLQQLAASAAGDAQFSAGLARLPAQAQPLVEGLPERVRQFASAHDFVDAAWLGQGPFYALAQEATLKLTEMSCTYAQSFHTLEFRHGPRAIVGSGTLIAFLMSERGYAAERAVLADIKALGATTMVVANEAGDTARCDADFLVELGLDVPELARLAASVIPAQLLGLYTSRKKGLDPDQPRHLTRVVTVETAL